MSLVVFSKNYFASTWCLGELEKIMECSKNLQHIVLPIFYEIKPSDIRKLKGCIAETLAKHEEEVPNMENWRTTLTEVASLAGFVSNNYRDEASMVEDIVEEVQGKLNLGIHLNVATHPVGIVPRLQNLLKLLCLESSNDVRIIAIWGVGGLGKCSRLWDCKDAFEVLKNFEGTKAVEGLILLPNKKDIQVNAKSFQKMKRLRILHLDHVLLSAGYEHLSRDLVWLRWHHFGLSALPPQLYLENLVALDLSYSNIKQVWRVTKGALSFRICHSGGMFPDWLQHETTNSYYALKVPPLGVRNKHFMRCIFYVVHMIADLNHLFWYMWPKLHNKTKDVYIYFNLINDWFETATLIGDLIIFYYTSFHVDELHLEEGDIIEISWTYGNVVLKKWGIHVSYYTTDDHH